MLQCMKKSGIQHTDKSQFNLCILQVWNAYLWKGSSYQTVCSVCASFCTHLVINVFYRGPYGHPCTRGVLSIISKETYSHLWFSRGPGSPAPTHLWIRLCMLLEFYLYMSITVMVGRYITFQFCPNLRAYMFTFNWNYNTCIFSICHLNLSIYPSICYPMRNNPNSNSTPALYSCT